MFINITEACGVYPNNKKCHFLPLDYWGKTDWSTLLPILFEIKRKNN